MGSSQIDNTIYTSAGESTFLKSFLNYTYIAGSAGSAGQLAVIVQIVREGLSAQGIDPSATSADAIDRPEDILYFNVHTVGASQITPVHVAHDIKTSRKLGEGDTVVVSFDATQANLAQVSHSGVLFALGDTE